MKQQIENQALSDSKFVFDEVIRIDIDFHRLNLTRGSSYLPLPDWLAKNKANNKLTKRRPRVLQLGCNCCNEVGRNRQKSSKNIQT